MPYFYNNYINILFIHIPKTGGTSLEQYLSNKFNIPLNNKSLYLDLDLDIYKNKTSYKLLKKYNIPLNNKSLYLYLNKSLYQCSSKKLINNIVINSSLQHMTYQTIFKYYKFFNINYNNINIISIVRNPYERIISDLFFLSKITIETSKDDVFDIIKSYLISDNLDNHNIPQYLFITDNNKKLIPNIKILHTETLTMDIINLGFNDFNIYANYNLIKTEETNYYSYLNNESINLINNFYDYDFKLFNYNKIIIKN